MADDDKKKDDENQFTKLDPETLSDELKVIYKSMQGDYTTKTQALADMRKEFETKETKFEEQLKTFGAAENEVKQWRDWYKQLEEQSKDIKSDDDVKLDDLNLNLDPNNDDPNKANADMNKVIAALDKQIKDLQGEITSVHTGMKDSRDQTNRMFSYNAQLNELADKYTGINKQEVLDHALKIGQTNLEKAYKDLHQEDLISSEVERRVKEELDKDRTGGPTNKGPGHQVILRSDKDTPKTFAEASEQILAGK